MSLFKKLANKARQFNQDWDKSSKEYKKQEEEKMREAEREEKLRVCGNCRWFIADLYWGDRCPEREGTGPSWRACDRFEMK